MTGLEIETRKDGDIGVLELSGEARVESMPHLEAASEVLVGDGARHLLVDLSRLRFMDSASAGHLLRLDVERKEAGGSVVLYDLHRMVVRLFDAAGLSDHFQVAASEEAARLRIAGFADQ